MTPDSNCIEISRSMCGRLHLSGKVYHSDYHPKADGKQFWRSVPVLRLIGTPRKPTISAGEGAMGKQKNQVDASPGDAERPRWSGAAALGHGGRMSRPRKSATVLRLLRGSGNGIARPGCRNDSQTASHALSGWKGSSRPNYYWGGSACLELDQRSRNREDRGQTGCLTADVNTAEFGGGPCVRRTVCRGEFAIETLGILAAAQLGARAQK